MITHQDGRMDNRSVEDFQQDVQRDSLIEADIALRVICRLFAVHKKWYPLEATGIDASGAYIADVSHVKTSAPDYTINTVPTEIMHSKPWKTEFHIKKYKLDSCLQNKNSVLLMVMGYDLAYPTFCILSYHELQPLKEKSLNIFGLQNYHPGSGKGAATVAKLNYKIRCNWIAKWYTLPPLPDTMPEQYDSIRKLLTEVH